MDVSVKEMKSFFKRGSGSNVKFAMGGSLGGNNQPFWFEKGYSS